MKGAGNGWLNITEPKCPHVGILAVALMNQN